MFMGMVELLVCMYAVMYVYLNTVLPCSHAATRVHACSMSYAPCSVLIPSSCTSCPAQEPNKKQTANTVYELFDPMDPLGALNLEVVDMTKDALAASFLNVGGC